MWHLFDSGAYFKDMQEYRTLKLFSVSVFAIFNKNFNQNWSRFSSDFMFICVNKISSYRTQLQVLLQRYSAFIVNAQIKAVELITMIDHLRAAKGGMGQL